MNDWIELIVERKFTNWCRCSSNFALTCRPRTKLISHKSYETLALSRYVTAEMKFHNNVITYFRSFVLSSARVYVVVSKPQLSVNIASVIYRCLLRWSLCDKVWTIKYNGLTNCSQGPTCMKDLNFNSPEKKTHLNEWSQTLLIEIRKQNRLFTLSCKFIDKPSIK